VSDRVSVPSLPPCDFDVRELAVIDGRTVAGPWAFMCQRHWEEYGVGRLGTGFGQRLVVEEER
jgi:hypothetical protein